MEAQLAKEELLNFKTNLILEYDYYLDLIDKIGEIERFETIADYTEAIEKYSELKKIYIFIRIAACTISTAGMAGFFGLLSLLDSETSKKVIDFGIVAGAALGLGGSYFFTEDFYSSEKYKELIANNNVCELKKQREVMIEKISLLFSKSNLLNLEDEKEKILIQISILAHALYHIDGLEDSIMRKYYSVNKEAVIYGEDPISKQKKAEKELISGYSLVKTYL